jgi:hypothetical protein
MIRKNSFINVKRNDGTVILARATKVAPWVKNPKVTVVNWISFDEQWKGVADLKNCTLATAIEIPKEPVGAPVDPSMAQWSLGKIKRGPQMMEGYYFAIPVLFNGVKVGELVDEGNGGCVITRFKDYTLAKTFEDACDKWALENGADGRCNDGKEHFWGWWDEARPKGIDAKTFFKSERESMLKFMAGV